MYVFLIAYILIVILWFIWALILSYHLVKYHFPKDNSKIFLEIFWGVSLFILVVSVLFIVQADWSATPSVYKIFKI